MTSNCSSSNNVDGHRSRPVSRRQLREEKSRQLPAVGFRPLHKICKPIKAGDVIADEITAIGDVQVFTSYNRVITTQRRALNFTAKSVVVMRQST
jgi:hypothetical protein